MQIDPAVSGAGTMQHVIRSPQRGGKGVTHIWLTAAKTGVSLSHSVGQTRDGNCLMNLFDLVFQALVRPAHAPVSRIRSRDHRSVSSWWHPGSLLGCGWPRV